jgi:predicted HTH transcriptional regulator
MTTLRKPSLNEISEVLSSGHFDQLISSVEYKLLECKGAVYDLKNNFERVELAKDVSALANAKGGYLLMGLASPMHKGDEITRVSSFTQDLCDLNQISPARDLG